MTEKKRFLGGGHIGILALVFAFLFAGDCVLANQQAGPPEEAKFEIFSLKHISIDQGKKYLAEVIKGTVTHFPGSSALLVTAEPQELAKAKNLLDLVDEPGQFVIKAILPVSSARNLPSNEQIAARLSPSLTRGVCIGSFSNPPSSDAKIKAIIDIHNDTVVAIAPPSLIDLIVAVIGQSPDIQASKQPNKSRIQDKSVVRPERQISLLPALNEAKFLLSAKGEIDADPNAIEDVIEDEAAQASSANPSYQLAPLVNGEQVVNLSLGERQKLTIIELLGLVGPYLKLDFIYTEKDIDQEISINPHGKYAGPIKVKDLYPMLEAVLKHQNLAMTRSGGNFVSIAQVAKTLDIDPTFIEDDKSTIKRGDGMIQRVFKLDHIQTSTAKTLLEGMKLTTNLTEIPETKTLIITAYAYRMPRIQSLLNIVDKPGEPKKFRFRPLDYTMAQTLAPKLQALAEQLGTISITIATEQATPTSTARPTRKSGESATAYNARLRQWTTAQAQRARSSASRTSTSTQQGQPTTPTVFLDADERTNRILMIGLDKQLDEVEKLIETLDVAQQDLRSLEVYKIEHVDAEEVKMKLEELGIITPRMMSPYGYGSRLTGDPKSPTTSTTAAARTTAARTTAMSSRMRQDEMMEAPLDEPQVIVISQINSLLVNATTEQHAKILKIKEYVDQETDEDLMPVVIYPLENQSPGHLEEVLRPLIEETIMDKEGKAVQEVKKKQEDDQIEIVSDPNTFSLIVYASKKNQEWIGKLIEKLDKRRSQVLIDVTLVEISKTDSFNYDLNIIQSFPDLTDTSGLTSAIMGGVGIEPYTANNLVSTLTNSSRDRFIDFQANAGTGTGFYGDEHINILLTAMQQKDYGRVLAKPKLLVNDNEEGIISTTDITYVKIETGTIVEGVGNTVQTGVSYEPYDAGIELRIVPHISRGDFLRLDIVMNRDDFGTITLIKPPDTSGTNIDTTVTVPDGSTIILGGMLKLNQSKGGSKIPILGDLPIVGGLFRSTSNNDIQKNLYVFVKAEIIRPTDTDFAQADSHLHQISDRNREAFEKSEKEFQEYQDWPGLTPKAMEPINVLDAQ
ncbi:secretin N-terminal domain-containing protein [Planctomycetota bacterium]